LTEGQTRKKRRGRKGHSRESVKFSFQVPLPGRGVRIGERGGGGGGGKDKRMRSARLTFSLKVVHQKKKKGEKGEGTFLTSLLFFQRKKKKGGGIYLLSFSVGKEKKGGGESDGEPRTKIFHGLVEGGGRKKKGKGGKMCGDLFLALVSPGTRRGGGKKKEKAKLPVSPRDTQENYSSGLKTGKKKRGKRKNKGGRDIANAGWAFKFVSCARGKKKT